VTNGTGAVAGIVIGNSDPDVNGETSDILVSGNTIDNDGSNQPQVYLYAGVRIAVAGNTFTMLNVTGGATSLFIRGSREGGATATYTDDIRVEDNLFHGTNAGGAYTPVEFGIAAAASTITADFVGNRLVIPGNVFVFDAPQTNPNIHVVDMPATGLRASRLAPQ
jgi:hypothetical protein